MLFPLAPALSPPRHPKPGLFTPALRGQGNLVATGCRAKKQGLARFSDADLVLDLFHGVGQAGEDMADSPGAMAITSEPRR